MNATLDSGCGSEESVYDQLEAYARQSLYAVVITDGERRVKLANSAFTDLCGYPEQELLGRNVGEMIQGEQTSAETVERMRRKLDLRAPFSFKFTNYHKDGFTYITGGIILPFCAEGETPLFLAVERELESFDERIHEEAGYAMEVAEVLSILSA